MNNLKTAKTLVLALVVMMGCSKQLAPDREWEISQQAPAIKVSRTVPPSRKIYTGEERREFPSKDIPSDKFKVVTAIEKYDHVFDSLPDGSAFVYGFKKDFRQGVAIRRGNEWVSLDWSVFSLSAPAGLTLSWIDVDGKGSKELMLTMDRSDKDSNVESFYGGTWIDTWTGAEYKISDMWRQAKGFCILDIDAMRFLVDNAYTGYHYAYELEQYVQGPESKEQGYVWPEAHYKNKRRKDIEIWYDMQIAPGQGTISMKRIACETKITIDKSVQYSDKKKQSEPPAPEVIRNSPECLPMYAEGTYRLRDGKFVIE